MTDRNIECRRGTCHLPLAFALEFGGELLGAYLEYELQGPANAPVVVVLGGISAHRHVTASPDDPTEGWFDHLAGAGQAIDTSRFRVLGIDFLAPATPAATEHLVRSPALSTKDHANALLHVLDHLEIGRLHAVVGASLGGGIALQLGAQTTCRVDRIVAISAADRPDPRASAWRSVQRNTVRALTAAGQPARGLELARALAMTTYRTADELADRFDQPAAVTDGIARTPIEDYLEARGADFAERFSPGAFLSLSQSLDLHRVDPAQLRAPTTLIGVRSDALVRIDQLRELADAVRSAGRTTCTLREFDSRYGHDAFLKEGEVLAPWLAAALDSSAQSLPLAPPRTEPAAEGATR